MFTVQSGLTNRITVNVAGTNEVGKLFADTPAVKVQYSTLHTEFLSGFYTCVYVTMVMSIFGDESKPFRE